MQNTTFAALTTLPRLGTLRAMNNVLSMNPIDRAKFDVHPDVDSRFTLGVLTPRMRRMIETYVREGTYTAAARASGYAVATVKRYIEENHEVRRAVGQLIDQASILAGVTLERVLQEYARLAFADIAEVADLLRDADSKEAVIDLLRDLPADTTAAISELTMNTTRRTNADGEATETVSVKVKLFDKRVALQDLARMLSLFNDTITVEGNLGFGEQLERAIAKLEEIKALTLAGPGTIEGTTNDD